MAEISIEVDTRIEDVDREAWGSLRAACEADVFTDPRFLRCVEQWLGETSHVWHVLLRDAERQPIASATLCTFPVDLVILAPVGVRGTLAGVRRTFPNVLRPVTLFCGTPVSVGQSHLLVRAGADPTLVMNKLDELMTDLATQTRSALLCHKEIAGEPDALMAALQRRGFTPLASLPMHEFDARPFASWDDYLARLTAHYRHDINRSLRRAARRGLQLRRLSRFDEIVEVYTEQIHALYYSVVDKSEYQFERLSRGFFIDIAAAFKGQVHLTVGEVDGRIIGFNWSLHSDSRYYLLFCGVDYELNRQCDLYFNLMYAELRGALNLGAQTIQFGQTADHFKARLGCHEVPRSVMIKSPSRVVNALLQSSRGLLEAQTKPVHHPAIYHAAPAV